MKIFFAGILVFLSVCFADSHIHEHGYWIGDEILHQHKFDQQLANALSDFFQEQKAQSVVDFGCGMGDYLKVFLRDQIQCVGYDGNPDSAKMTNGLVQVLDLSQPFDLKKQFDWVLCLEVGEHIPKQYEQTLIENLDKHAKVGIILSWAIKGQGGYGHFNEQDNGYVKDLMAKYGYENDLEQEKYLRKCAYLPWFKNTVMVFRKRAKL